MTTPNQTTRFRFWLWLIALVGVIVPRRLRADWRQEWEAELQYRETLLAEWDRLDWRNKLALLWHSLGAFADALWMQPKRLEDEMFQDLRFGVRMLLKSPAFTLAAILSLVIGIGANTALFSVVNAVLWRPLPYPNAERLVRVGGWSLAEVFAGLKQTQRAFDGLAGWRARDYMLTGRGGPAHLKGQRVTTELLPLLGVTSQVGRAFVAEEFQPGRDQVAIISHRLWQSRFGADPQIIGQAVALDQQLYTVVGVTPPGFDFFPKADLLTPLPLTARDIRNPDYHLEIVARLKPGLTLEQARQEMARIAPVLEEQRNALIQRLAQRTAGPEGAAAALPFDAQRELRLQPLRELLVKDFRLSLLVLWGVVGFVLLIACANVANLMLARAANRQKELAIRAAVGARRTRLARQLMTESVLVAGVGGALGLLCAYLGVQALLKANPAILPQLSETAAMATIPRLGEVAINGWVMAFNFGLTLLTGALFGLAPALQFSRPDLNYALKEGAAVSAKGFRFGLRRGTQSLLVVGEVALALMLLVGAGLLIRSLWRLQQIEPGFKPDKLLTMQLEFPDSRYHNNAQVMSFVTELNERLAALPGVEGVGVADSLPLSPVGSFSSIAIEGKADLKAKPDEPLSEEDLGPSAFFSRVSPSYFRTLGMPLRQGREFGPEDRRRSLPVAIINEAMAHRYWPGENSLGKRLRADGVAWRTVVGVVGNVRRFALEDQPKPELYMPLLQPAIEEEKAAAEASAKGGKGETVKIAIATMVGIATQGQASYVSLMVRTSVPPEALADAVRKTVWSLDPDQPILQLGTMQARFDEIYAPRRFNLLLFGVFALVALLLTAVGIYGVLAYMVTQRTHEIGIRLALGAQTRDVLWLIVRQGLGLTLIGVSLGLVAALALTRVIQNLLYDMSATDPATFAGIALLFLSVACVASFIPAWRATKVDPLVALRHE